MEMALGGWVEMALGGDSSGIWIEKALTGGGGSCISCSNPPHFLTGGKHAFLCMASMLRTDGETRRFRSAGIDQGVGGAEGGERLKFTSRRGRGLKVKAAGGQSIDAA